MSILYLRVQSVIERKKLTWENFFYDRWKLLIWLVMEKLQKFLNRKKEPLMTKCGKRKKWPRFASFRYCLLYIHIKNCSMPFLLPFTVVFFLQHRSTLPSLLLCCTTSFVEMIRWVIYFSSYTCNITLYVSATALFHNGTTCICLIQQLPGAWAMIDGQVSFKNYCCYMYTTVLLTILEIHQQIR